MQTIIVEFLIILLLVLANGVLAMSELAVISARKARLQQMAQSGRRGADLAIELADTPSQFLSTVQIGITLVGVLAGAFGGATLAAVLADYFALVPLLAPYARILGVGLVVVAITYLTLVLGELVPKRLALRDTERIAAAVARPMQILSRVTAPLVHLLSASTDGVLWILRVRTQHEPAITEEEIRLMLEQGAESGVFEPMEEEIVGQVFRLADRKIEALVTPRTEIVWLDLNDDDSTIRRKVTESGRSRYPVADGHLDTVAGVVLAKDLLAQSLFGRPLDIQAILRPALFVPESTPALTVIERFKETHSKLAIVIDEFGGVEGLVTVDDIMGAIVGDIPEPGELEEPEAVKRADGTWLVDGLLPLDEFQILFHLHELPNTVGGYYQTVGGLVMAGLGRVPATGDIFEWGGLTMEVIDMDGKRVDKLLVTPLLPAADESSHG